jgi:hypothetical protein
MLIAFGASLVRNNGGNDEWAETEESVVLLAAIIRLQHEIRHLHQLGHAECQSIVLGGILAVSGVSHDCNDFRCQPDL